MKLSLLNGRLTGKHTYYSQMGEDKYFHMNYFSLYRSGTFLEMGAHDGAWFSNTKFFEDELGWSGVLIEPNPDSFAKLRNNRPRSQCYQFAVSETEGEVEFYKNGVVSSVKQNTSQEFFDGWHKGHDISVIKVPSRRLGSILGHAGVKRIDFWSLDIEGSEVDALKTMDWTIPVYLICMETQLVPEKKRQCDAILLTNGFVFVETFYHNEIWINPSHRRKN